MQRLSGWSTKRRQATKRQDSGCKRGYGLGRVPRTVASCALPCFFERRRTGFMRKVFPASGTFWRADALLFGSLAECYVLRGTTIFLR